MDLIEKAARVNCANFVERKWRNHADKDLAKRLMEINRRAVIEALREPSEAMINAARSHIDFEERVDIATERIQCRAAWRAMIDAALCSRCTKPRCPMNPTPQRGRNEAVSGQCSSAQSGGKFSKRPLSTRAATWGCRGRGGTR